MCILIRSIVERVRVWQQSNGRRKNVLFMYRNRANNVDKICVCTHTAGLQIRVDAAWGIDSAELVEI